MKCICCDTSFLFSAYTSDSQTSRAMAYLAVVRTPLTLSSLNLFELENALRLAGWQRLYTSGAINSALDAIDADRRLGQIIVTKFPTEAVIAKAQSLSVIYTSKGGYQTFDMLHVATALCLGADEFLTFDIQQRRLARAVGLKLNP